MKNGYLSSWAKNVAPSPTLAVDAKAKALKAAGEDVCGFGAGEPDFDTPSFIKDACAKALDEGKTKYAPAAGIPALRDELAQRYLEKGVLSEKNLKSKLWILKGFILGLYSNIHGFVCKNYSSHIYVFKKTF